MYVLRILIIVFLASNIGFSSTNPFDAPEWNQYRLNNPAQSIAVIETTRMRGVPVTKESFEDLRKAGLSIFAQPPVLTYWGGSRTDTVENTDRWNAFLMRAENRTKANLLSWRGFYLNDDSHKFLGFVGSHRFPNTGCSYDGAIEMVCALDSDSWRRGFATEAITGYVLSDISRLEDYNYIFTTTHPENVGSIGLGTKLGLNSWEFDSKDATLPGYLKTTGRLYWRIEKSDILARFEKK